jgi:hypothetical protein
MRRQWWNILWIPACAGTTSPIFHLVTNSRTSNLAKKNPTLAH